jgi:hypothetical protein
MSELARSLKERKDTADTKKGILVSGRSFIEGRLCVMHAYDHMLDNKPARSDFAHDHVLSEMPTLTEIANGKIWMKT